MISNSSLRTSKGVKNNDASKSEEEKLAQKSDKDRSKTFSSNQYPYRGYRNVRYSSYGNKVSLEIRQRDDYKMARGSYTRKTTRGMSKREYETYSTRRKFQDSAKGKLWRECVEIVFI